MGANNNNFNNFGICNSIDDCNAEQDIIQKR